MDIVCSLIIGTYYGLWFLVCLHFSLVLSHYLLCWSIKRANVLLWHNVHMEFSASISTLKKLTMVH
ncbi:hypothetical protein ACS0TY_030108 [Phlomoides rotata]